MNCRSFSTTALPAVTKTPVKFLQCLVPCLEYYVDDWVSLSDTVAMSSHLSGQDDVHIGHLDDNKNEQEPDPHAKSNYVVIVCSLSNYTATIVTMASITPYNT